jgi:hypothetical protein
MRTLACFLCVMSFAAVAEANDGDFQVLPLPVEALDRIERVLPDEAELRLIRGAVASDGRGAAVGFTAFSSQLGYVDLFVIVPPVEAVDHALGDVSDGGFDSFLASTIEYTPMDAWSETVAHYRAAGSAGADAAYWAGMGVLAFGGRSGASGAVAFDMAAKAAGVAGASATVWSLVRAAAAEAEAAYDAYQEASRKAGLTTSATSFRAVVAGTKSRGMGRCHRVRRTARSRSTRVAWRPAARCRSSTTPGAPTGIAPTCSAASKPVGCREARRRTECQPNPSPR